MSLINAAKYLVRVAPLMLKKKNIKLTPSEAAGRQTYEALKLKAKENKKAALSKLKDLEINVKDILGIPIRENYKMTPRQMKKLNKKK